MGKGDKKTRRGKIIMGSFGVSRNKNKQKSPVSVISKPKETKNITVVEEIKEVIVEQPQIVEVEKKEKPKKEIIKSEKVKEVPEEKEKKTIKKSTAKKAKE